MGTFLLVLIGTGSVASAVLTGALTGLWQVAVVWGFGVSIAIYASAAASGAHLNPAVTLAFALLRRDVFPITRVPGYWLAQLLGAFLAGLVVLAVFSSALERFEVAEGLVRGDGGSERSAMVFGEYFPNPAVFGVDEAARKLVSPFRAFAVEALGTGVLVFVIFALVDPRNETVSRASTPMLIGFTVAVLIALFAPLTQAGWNPARDFGPRLVSFLAGWDAIALPGPRGGFWVYIAGPLVGGPLGGMLYDQTLGRI
jgi:MIP family channel proteins